MNILKTKSIWVLLNKVHARQANDVRREVTEPKTGDI